MKTDKIKCAWIEMCDGEVTRTMKLVGNSVQVTFSKCHKCGNFTIQDKTGKIIKYHPNK